MMNKLLEKSKMNKITAAWAENKKYFDVAISRYYYELFQKTIVILNYHNKNNIPNEETNKHKATIDTLLRETGKGKEIDLPGNYKLQLLAFATLSRRRKDADYKNYSISNIHDFKNKFKKTYGLVCESLDYILSDIGMVP